jgi:hypothetical protein
MQGKVEVQVATTRIRKLSCGQDIIVPHSEEKYLYNYASGCPHCLWT